MQATLAVGQSKKLDLQNCSLSCNRKDVWVYCQLLVCVTHFLLYIALSATLFCHLQQIFSAVKVNHNCLCQFIWHLHSIEVILAELITACFVQWNSSAVFTGQMTTFSAVFAPLLHLHTAHIVCKTKNVILDCDN